MPRPSRYRYVILALLCALAMITYMDRAANGSAKTAIMKDLNANGGSYTVDDFFYVLMAFQLAYALFEVPSGFLGDTFGPRSTLLRVVLWWTVFVALTAFTGLTLPGGLYFGFLTLMAGNLEPHAQSNHRRAGDHGRRHAENFTVPPRPASDPSARPVGLRGVQQGPPLAPAVEVFGQL